MGCFNKIGFYSKLPIIYGDKIVIFLCTTIKNVQRNDANPIYIDELVQPLSLPIFCEYDEYGGGENFEQDANLKLIESVFGTKIDELISFLCGKIYTYSPDIEDEIGKSINKFLEQNTIQEYGIFYTMERRDVFDKMVEISNKPFFQIEDYNKGSYIGDYWLNKLGFICVEKHNKTFRYNNIYKLKDVETEYFVTSDGHVSNICKGLSIIDTFYDGIKDFINKWEKITGIPLQYDKSNESTNRVDISYDISLEAYKRYIKVDEEIKDYKNNSNFFTDRHYSGEMGYNDIWVFSYHMQLHMEDFSLCLYKCLNIEQLKELKPVACQLANFNKTLGDLCGSYEFSYYGHQGVCYSPYIEEFDELHKFYGSVINQMIEQNYDVD